LAKNLVEVVEAAACEMPAVLEAGGRACLLEQVE